MGCAWGCYNNRICMDELPPSKRPACLLQVDTLPAALAAKDITYKDFMNLHQVRQMYPKMSSALIFCSKTNGGIKKDVFAKLTRKMTGVQLSETIVDIIFHLYSDECGSLNIVEFSDMLCRCNTGRLCTRLDDSKSVFSAFTSFLKS